MIRKPKASTCSSLLILSCRQVSAAPTKHDQLLRWPKSGSKEANGGSDLVIQFFDLTKNHKILWNNVTPCKTRHTLRIYTMITMKLSPTRSTSFYCLSHFDSCDAVVTVSLPKPSRITNNNLTPQCPSCSPHPIPNH